MRQRWQDEGRRPGQGALRRMRALAALTLLALVSAQPAAAQDPGLAMVQRLQSEPLPWGWSLEPQGTATLLRNSGASDNAHMVIYTPAPSGELIRSTLIIAGLSLQDPAAHMAVLLAGAEGLCMLGLYGDRSAELTCAAGEQMDSLGRRTEVLKLDGTDRIQVLELGAEAAFYVNHQEIGRVSDHPALGKDFGLAFSGRGEFLLSTFSVAHMTEEQLAGPAPSAPPPGPGGAAPAAPPAAPPTAPPAAGAGFEIPAVPPRAGWQDRRDSRGVTLLNEAVQGDERLLPLDLPPLQGGQRVTELDVTVAPTSSGQQSLRAAAGLLYENAEQGQSCGVQVTASGDALLLCYTADGRGLEVARQAGAARGPGPHRLSVTESGDLLSASVNGTPLGTLKAHPVIGGQVSLIAWDRGAFTFSPLRLQAERGPEGTAPAAPRGPRPAGSLGDHLSGPLPLFGPDRARAEAVYLGVTRSVLMHELGHALIGELGVPATGPEEDAVDIYAALHLAEQVVQSGAERGPAGAAATYASLLWYYSGRLEEQQSVPASQGWQDEHTGGLKRFRNMFCVIYGADPRGFSELARSVGLEERTLSRCEDEFLKQNRAWRAILSPYARISPAMPEGRLPASAPGAAVEVTFHPSQRQIGEHIRQSYAEELTRAAEALGAHYALPRPLQVIFRDCDVANAWYYPKEGSVTMCYDIVEHFVVMISDIEMSTEAGYSEAERGLAPVAQGTGTAAQPGGQIAQAQAELTDFGIPSGVQLFLPPFRGPTPVENPRARTITTPEIVALIQAAPDVVILDIREGTGLQSLPGAWQLSGAGRDGSLQDSLQMRLGEVLTGIAGPDKDRAVVVLGDGPEDRAAWNAALRIGQEGYPTSWYRGGISAWRAAGLPLTALK